MNIRTAQRLRRLSNRGAIDRGFKNALKKSLLAQTEHATRPFRVLKPVAAGLTALLIFGMTTGAYAYASKNVLPDHPLYGVRHQIERVESAIVSGNPRKQADVAIKHLERRVQEIDLMEGALKEVDEDDVERVAQAVKEAMDVAAETEETETCDDKIRNAEMRSTSMFQKAFERNEEGKKAVDKSTKDLGRAVWMMDDARRSRYENIELRYEAGLFGMHWKLDNGRVVVDEKEDVDAIVQKLPPESVSEVVQAIAPVPAIDDADDASVENPEEPTADEAETDDVPPADEEIYTDATIVHDRGFDWTGTETEAEGGFADRDGNERYGVQRDDERMVRERLRNYFERLHLQR